MENKELLEAIISICRGLSYATVSYDAIQEFQRAEQIIMNLLREQEKENE